MATKPAIPKGTRDFSPLEMARRNYIFDTIKDVFRLHGFSQIETPAMENLSTLLGKYGDEGDKLLFKILNSGDFLKGIDPAAIDPAEVNKLAVKICEKGLRYDLTVPFARYVVQHRSELQFPFKRYQIQPVWRADRPQKGRYREFYQCDADIVGSDSLLNEVELLDIIRDVFSRLNINVVIKVNNRKILAGIAEVIGAPDSLVDITVAIDKIDKIGLENVKAELAERGLAAEAIEALTPIITLTGSTAERLAALKSLLAASEIGLKGVEELETILAMAGTEGAEIELDVSLARGLNYYTGTIIEVKALDTPIGSITGGGRYDNLTGVFGMPGVSGVGISFGADRIYDVLNTLDLYPDDAIAAPRCLFTNFGPAEAARAMELAKQLRSEGISCVVFPDAAKIKKQMSYADAMKFRYVAIIGETELADGTVTVKNMAEGTQATIAAADLAAYLSANSQAP
ncbi:MAG: histidine--tRNA ligase, partial [Muribaculaceae bacterium]|nr:histidine--tRNA ligase [Muribaculaceae bacterium]